jgi:hypothetical protein
MATNFEVWASLAETACLDVTAMVRPVSHFLVFFLALPLSASPLCLLKLQLEYKAKPLDSVCNTSYRVRGAVARKVVGTVRSRLKADGEPNRSVRFFVDGCGLESLRRCCLTIDCRNSRQQYRTTEIVARLAVAAVEVQMGGYRQCART